MSRRTTRYVRLARVMRSGRLQTTFAAVTDPHYNARQDVTSDRPPLGVFEVEGCTSAAAAVGAVAEWLHAGRPDAMTVREVTR